MCCSGGGCYGFSGGCGGGDCGDGSGSCCCCCCCSGGGCYGFSGGCGGGGVVMVVVVVVVIVVVVMVLVVVVVGVCLRAWVRVCVHVRVYMGVRTCVCACVRACLHACVLERDTTSDVFLDDTACFLDGLVVLWHGGSQSLGAVVTHKRQLEVSLLVQSFSFHVESLRFKIEQNINYVYSNMMTSNWPKAKPHYSSYTY